MKRTTKNKKKAAKKTATKRAAKMTKRKTTTQVATSERVPAAPATTATAPKETKKDLVLGLLQRDNGATLAELMTSTGWQAHSLRGFISGTLRKKLGLTIERVTDVTEPTYRVKAS